MMQCRHAKQANHSGKALEHKHLSSCEGCLAPSGTPCRRQKTEKKRLPGVCPCKHTLLLLQTYFSSCESCLALTGRPCLSCRAICSCGTCSSHPTVQRCCAATGACIACPYQCDALTLKAFLQYLRCTDCRAEPDTHPAALCFSSIYKRYRNRTWCRTWYITWCRTWYSTWYRTWYRIRTAALHLRQW